MNPMINNTAILCGKSLKDFREYHQTINERFFMFSLSNKRKSDVEDILPIVISEKLITPALLKADFLSMSGQIRTFNDDNGRVEIYFFVKDIEIIEEEKYFNEVELKGFLCKKGNYRDTYSGRKIIDFILAVNRLFRKSDYLPILAWGKDAKYIFNQDISTEVKIVGRFQSRTYLKKINEDEKIEKIAYEISASQINIVRKEEN